MTLLLSLVWQRTRESNPTQQDLESRSPALEHAPLLLLAGCPAMIKFPLEKASSARWLKRGCNQGCAPDPQA